jgi:hypothetical protein
VPDVLADPVRVSRVVGRPSGGGENVSEERATGWVGTPLDADRIDPRGIAEIVVEFDEGEEIITPKTKERFGSYELNEAARYIFFLSNHIQKGGMG